MAYNTKLIVTDKDGNPISQYYNPTTDKYEPVEGYSGANKVLIENNDLSLIPILDKISQLTGTVIDEETRKSNEDIRNKNEITRIQNEDIRQTNEQDRVNLYNDLESHKAEKATQGKLGHVKVDGKTIFINEDGEISSARWDDTSGSPGSIMLISGTMEEGFFGEVPASELITGDALASECGISTGTSQHSTAGWLKFAYKGEIQFVAKKPIRHSISWDAINTANCVYGDSGDKTVTIDDKTYKVTLMRALEPSNDPKTTASANSGTVNHHSEWNRLICQIHEEAINGNWYNPKNIESDIGILEHSLGSGSQGMYSDADLVVKSGDGKYSWCQEISASASYRLTRGSLGVSNSSSNASSYTSSNFGWRPVLELVP